jgi:hypothetical protein
MGYTTEIKTLKTFRVKDELKIVLIKTINKFKSKEEPGTELDKKDVIDILAQLISSQVR